MIDIIAKLPQHNSKAQQPRAAQDSKKNACWWSTFNYDDDVDEYCVEYGNATMPLTITIAPTMDEIFYDFEHHKVPVNRFQWKLRAFPWNVQNHHEHKQGLGTKQRKPRRRQDDKMDKVTTTTFHKSTTSFFRLAMARKALVAADFLEEEYNDTIDAGVQSQALVHLPHWMQKSIVMTIKSENDG